MTQSGQQRTAIVRTRLRRVRATSISGAFYLRSSAYDRFVNPQFKKLYESLVQYRATSYAWLQVAELGFDNFMMRMRTRT
jgi:TRAP-type mannitol/chloroaromatic compound transport system substrate-binding protein